jgi:aspartyl-tRNA(Asn)/glutamyl-tRNA(Gln) amidotransferase subunit A
MPDDLASLTLHETADLLRTGKVSSVEVTRAYYDRIEKLDPELNCYIGFQKEWALSQAAQADRDRSRGSDKPLLGVPIAIKDLICTEGVPTTCGSKILENFIPPYDAFVVRKLKGQGAVFLGKTNMDEFAMGSSNENSHFGPVKNPWDKTRIPGGSSGGSAGAVAADLCAGALASDTGGSIRQPAACSGVVGLKPTYGRVSRFGLVAFASSLDQIGTITKDVRDSAILMNCIAGYDPMDSTSADVEVPDYTRALVQEVKGLRIGIPKEYFIEGMDPEVETAVRKAVEHFKTLGVDVVDVSLPHSEYGISAYYVIAPAEASSNLARYDGVKYGFRVKDPKDLMSMYRDTRMDGFGKEVKRRIMLGTYMLRSGYYDANYLKAQKVRGVIKKDFLTAFEKCDVIATPTFPTPAFRLGEKVNNPMQMYLSDVFTVSANLAGICGISIPCGFSSNGLPIGLQLLGKHFGESDLLHAAFAYEQTTDHHKRKPPI